MNLRNATIEDTKMLLGWRNDPLTVAASITPGTVKLADHIKWLAASIQNRARTLLVAEVDGEPVGIVRIDPGELSWTVAPRHRRKGYGKIMVNAALERTGPICARIKENNTASQRIVEACGFTLLADGPLQEWRYSGSAGTDI